MPAEKRCMFNCSYYNITSSSGSRCSISFFPQSHFLSSFLSHVGAPFYFCLFHFHSITYTARHPNGDASKHAVSQMETLFFLSSWYLIWLFRVFFCHPLILFSLFFRFIMRLLMSNNNVHFYEYADGWTTEDLVFLWRAGDPVQVANNLQLPRFALEKFKTDSCNSKTNTG
jgi:hypothetical protein